jgi:hypothetical protein
LSLLKLIYSTHLYLQDLALAYCKHVEKEHHSAYEDFVNARNEVALDVGFVAPVDIPATVITKYNTTILLRSILLYLKAGVWESATKGQFGEVLLDSDCDYTLKYSRRVSLEKTMRPAQFNSMRQRGPQMRLISLLRKSKADNVRVQTPSRISIQFHSNFPFRLDFRTSTYS